MKKTALLALSILVATATCGKTKGYFSFGLAADRTSKKFSYSDDHSMSKSRDGISKGIQLTLGCYYRQNWLLLGVSGGVGVENYDDSRQRPSRISTAGAVAELTAAYVKRIAGRALYATGGVIPSIHFDDDTRQPFVISPYLGLILAPAKRFAAEARIGYDPIFRQSRIGISLRF